MRQTVSSVGGASLKERISENSADGYSYFPDDIPPTIPDLSRVSRGIALSPRGTSAVTNTEGQIPSNFSTARFLAATMITATNQRTSGSFTPGTDSTGSNGANKENLVSGTVVSRSTILTPVVRRTHRRCSSRNVKVLELPINKRLSVPWDDVYEPGADDQPVGCFLRRVNSDVVWGDPIISLDIKQKKDSIVTPSPTPTPKESCVSTKIPPSLSLTEDPHGLSLGYALSSSSTQPIFGLNSKTVRRRQIIPALDQMALDLRAGWMGEDDVEEELQEVEVFDATDNTRINRAGEANSIFFIGQKVMSLQDVDYFCGIVPAGTTGEITRIANWRLYVKWQLSHFQNYGECEVCASEVSIRSSAKLSFIRSGTYVHPDTIFIDSESKNEDFTKNPTDRKVNFNISEITYVDPDLDAVPDCLAPNESDDNASPFTGR